MLFFLPGRKHAVKPLFAHRRVSLEEFMLLYGLEVRALLPEVAPRLAFDNNEQTGAFLWFSHFRLHHVTMIVVFPRVAVKGLALLRTNPFFIKGYNYYSQGKFKNIILHTDEIQGMKFNKFFFFFFTLEAKFSVKFNKSSGPCLSESYLLLLALCVYSRCVTHIKCCFWTDLFLNFRRIEKISDSPSSLSALELNDKWVSLIYSYMHYKKD